VPTLTNRPTRTWRHLLIAAGVLCVCLWTAAPVHAQGQLYKVRPGDTLAAIAAKHDTTVNAIMRLNKITDPNVIRPGQQLEMPPSAARAGSGSTSASAAGGGTGSSVGIGSPAASPEEPTRVYIALPGDSLASIATKFKTTPARLAELNQQSPSSALHVGQPLRVPEVAGVKYESALGDEIPVAGNYVVHVLQPGESAASVAQEYGTSLRRTLQLNNIADASQLKPGMRLIVPPPSFAELFADIPIGDDGYPLYPVIPTEGKWISVDLDRQRTFAWEGNKLIKSFLISSGKARTPTVTGVFRIWGKIAAQRMEGGSRAAGDYYNLPNVQWVQYFYQDYSFHGTYWHHNFGTPMSHGCVNMTNDDAKWLFDWATPTVEGYGWHTTDRKDPGALVVIYQ
jgi:LysM repeat protein